MNFTFLGHSRTPVIPPFMKAVDAGISYLHEDGLFGVADFFTSAKFDLPNRQHTYSQRCFWRSVFDLDGIDLGPDRRQYLENNLEPGIPSSVKSKIMVFLTNAPHSQFMSIMEEGKSPMSPIYAPLTIFGLGDTKTTMVKLSFLSSPV